MKIPQDLLIQYVYISGHLESPHQDQRFFRQSMEPSIHLIALFIPHNRRYTRNLRRPIFGLRWRGRAVVRYPWTGVEACDCVGKAAVIEHGEGFGELDICG
jgi:hypothetical protein